MLKTHKNIFKERLKDENKKIENIIHEDQMKEILVIKFRHNVFQILKSSKIIIRKSELY
jgi:hypothetical protein